MRSVLLSRLDAVHDVQRFAAERAQSLPPPVHRFDARRTHTPSVFRRSLVCVEGAYYSVPCKWAGIDYRHYPASAGS